MSSLPKPGAEQARYPCSKCGKAYTKRSHLSRHEPTHSGQKPSRCPFCGCSFVKSEVARRHARTCAQRGNSALPPGEKRGRKAQACDKCAKNKALCDKARPCTRCRAQNMECTYRRLEVDNESMQMQFLLRYTDTSQEHPAPALVDGGADVAELVATESSYPLFPADDASFGWSLYDLFFDRVPDPLLDIADEEIYMPWLLSPNVSDATGLGSRVDEMVDALSSTHDRMRYYQLADAPEFDSRLIRSALAEENLVEFLRIYFIRCYPQAPIVHRRGFTPQTASIPLLLGIIASAAVFSVPSDHAIAARCFLRDIEEFIFSQPPFEPTPQQNNVFPELEVLQAAWMIVAIQGNRNNRQTGGRIRMERLPKLIAIIRGLGLPLVRHGEDAEDWQLWMENEIRIRLSIFTFWIDSHNSMFFSSPPQMAISEMIGDLPCNEELFEATPPQFAQLLLTIKRIQVPPLSKFIPMLLHGPIPDTLPRCLQVHHLVIVISALQSTLFAARTSGFGKEALGTVFRATERWESLWNTVTGGMAVEDQTSSRTGFMKHAAEVCWLVRTVVRVAESGDLTSTYMRSISTDSVTDLHGFIRKYKDLYSCA